jgi:hypothetical protein
VLGCGGYVLPMEVWCILAESKHIRSKIRRRGKGHSTKVLHPGLGSHNDVQMA